jgi:hypothetical protein
VVDILTMKEVAKSRGRAGAEAQLHHADPRREIGHAVDPARFCATPRPPGAEKCAWGTSFRARLNARREQQHSKQQDHRGPLIY